MNCAGKPAPPPPTPRPRPRPAPTIVPLPARAVCSARSPSLCVGNHLLSRRAHTPADPPCLLSAGVNKRMPSATPLQRASAPPLRAAASRPPPRVQRGRGAAFLGRHWARATRMLRSLLTRRGRQSHWRSRRTTGRRRRRLCAATRKSTSEDARPEQPLPRGRTRVQRHVQRAYSSDSRPACECRVCSGARYSSFLYMFVCLY